MTTVLSHGPLQTDVPDIRPTLQGSVGTATRVSLVRGGRRCGCRPRTRGHAICDNSFDHSCYRRRAGYVAGRELVDLRNVRRRSCCGAEASRSEGILDSRPPTRLARSGFGHDGSRHRGIDRRSRCGDVRVRAGRLGAGRLGRRRGCIRAARVGCGEHADSDAAPTASAPSAPHDGAVEGLADLRRDHRSGISDLHPLECVLPLGTRRHGFGVHRHSGRRCSRSYPLAAACPASRQSCTPSVVARCRDSSRSCASWTVACRASPARH